MRNTYSHDTGGITSLLTERDRPETMSGPCDNRGENAMSRSQPVKRERRVD